MSNHYSRRAFELLAQLPSPAAMASGPLETASAATAHALLAIEARLVELVEQQRLANLIAAYSIDSLEVFPIGLSKAIQNGIDSLIQEADVVNTDPASEAS